MITRHITGVSFSSADNRQIGAKYMITRIIKKSKLSRTGVVVHLPK